MATPRPLPPPSGDRRIAARRAGARMAGKRQARPAGARRRIAECPGDPRRPGGCRPAPRTSSASSTCRARSCWWRRRSSRLSGEIGDALGVQWALRSGHVAGGAGFADSGLSIGTLLGALQASKPPAELPDGAIVGLGSRDFGALVTALSRNSRSNLLSTPEPADPGQPEGGNPGRPERTVPDRQLHHQRQRFEQSVHHCRAQGYRGDPQGHAAHRRGPHAAPGDRAGNILHRANRHPGGEGGGPGDQQALDQEHRTG